MSVAAQSTANLGTISNVTTWTIKLWIQQSIGQYPSHSPKVPSQTLHGTHAPEVRKYPQLQRVQVSREPETCTSAQFVGQLTHRLFSSWVDAWHFVHTSLEEHSRQFCWHLQHSQSDPRKQPSTHTAHRVADPDFDWRQLAAVATRQEPPEKQYPCMQAEQVLAGHMAQLAVEQAVHVTPVRQQPREQTAQVHTLATTLALAATQPVNAHSWHCPLAMMQLGQHERQLPLMSAIFLQLF